MVDQAQESPPAVPPAYDKDQPARGLAKLRTFSSLRHPNFRMLWTSVLLASAGQWMEQVALSWVAYELTKDPLVLGFVNGFKAVPALLSGPFGGVLADRTERKKLMIASQIVILIPAATLAYLLFTNQVEVWHLYLYAVITGLGWSFNMPVRQSLMANLVPREDLMNAIALQSSAFTLSRLVGPTIAGFVIAWFGAGAAFFLKAIMYTMVIAVTAAMFVPSLPGDRLKESAWRTMRSGLSYIRQQEFIFTLILLALIPMVFSQPYFTLLPVFAQEVLNVGPEGFGILVTLPGIGAGITTLGIASWNNIRKGRLMLGAAVLQAIVILSLAATSLIPEDLQLLDIINLNYAVAALFLMCMGCVQMGYNTLNNALLHSITTDEMRGRVMSVYLLDQGFAPLGTVWAGFLASQLGAPGAYLVMGFTVLGLAIAANLRFGNIRRM